MPAGRPTKYDPKYCDMIVEEFLKGGHMRTFAHLLDVEVKTLYNWMKQYPEFLQARNKAQNASFVYWNKINIGLATGKLKGNGAVCIFNTTNRFPEFKRDGSGGEEHEDGSDAWEDPESLT